MATNTGGNYEETVTLRINVVDSEKLMNVADATTQVRTNIESLQQSVQKGRFFGGFADDLKQELESASEFIDSAKKKIEGGGPESNSYARSLYSGDYEIGARSIEAIDADVKSLKGIFDRLNGIKFNKTDYDKIAAMIPNLNNLLRRVASTANINVDSHSALWSDEKYLASVMNNDEFKIMSNDLRRNLGVKNGIIKRGKIESDYQDFMKDLVMYSIKTEIDKTQRGTYMSHFGNLQNSVGTFKSYRDMLPGAFKNLYQGAKGISDSDFKKRLRENDLLNESEMKVVEQLARNNEFAAKALEQAGALYRSRGYMRLNNGITRQQINAAAGGLLGTIESGARGASRFGITDLNDPEQWERILNKSNARITGGLAGARYMVDNFSWLNPESFTEQQLHELSRARRKAVADSGNAALKGQHSIGRVKFNARPNSYEVTRYSLNDILEGRSWMTGDPSKFQDEAEHRFDVNGSLSLDAILRHANGGKTPGHNSYQNSVFYVDIDDRLKDPNTDPDVRKSLERDMGRLFTEGTTMNVNGKKYHFSATRINPKSTGIEFVRDDVLNSVKGELGQNFFSGGIPLFTYDKDGNRVARKFTAKEFAQYLEYSNKNATEGVDIRELLGNNTLPRKGHILITDLKELTQNADGTGGLDGASYISSRLTGGQTFQGRISGAKTVLNSINFDEFTKLAGGALPVYTVGSDANHIRYVNADTDLVLNKEDLKAFGISEFAGLTHDQIADMVHDRIKNGHMYVSKTSAQAGDSDPKWLSYQLAQTMDIDPDQAMKFSTAAFNLIKELGTPTGQIKHVFAGDEALQAALSSNPAMLNDMKFRSRVEAYRRNVFERLGRGDLYMPEGSETARGFLAPWAFNVFSDTVNSLYKDSLKPYGERKYTKEGFDLSRIPKFLLPNDWVVQDGKLLDEHRNQVRDLAEGYSRAEFGKMRLGDNEGLFAQIMADTLGLTRYPAAIGSVQTIKNMATNKEFKGKYGTVERFISQLGLDPNSVYLSQASPLLELMQSADFDGDMVDLFNLASDKNKTVSDMLSTIFTKTIKRHQDLRDAGKISEEEFDTRVKAAEKQIFGEQVEFDPTNPEDVGKWISAYALQSFRLGAPSAIQRNAMQIPVDSDVAYALEMAAKMYDTNTTSAKKGTWMTSDEIGSRIMANYKPWSEFNNTLKKSRDERGNIDFSKFRDTNLYKINAPFATMSGNVWSALLSRVIAKRHGFDVNSGLDWGQAFKASREGVLEKLINDEKSGLKSGDELTKETSKYLEAFEQWQSGILGADFLITSDKDALDLFELMQNAITAESALNRNGHKIIEALGGAVVRNLNDERIGLTERVLTGDPVWAPKLAGWRKGNAFGELPISNFSFKDLNGEPIKITQKQAMARTRLDVLQNSGRDALRQQADALPWSTTNVLGFVDPVHGGVNWVAENWGNTQKEQTQPNEHTVFGHVAEDIIQDYFARREEILNGEARALTDIEKDILRNGDEEHEGLLNEDTLRKRLLRDLNKAGFGSSFNAIAGVNGIEDIVTSKRGSVASKYRGFLNFLTDHEHGLESLFSPEEYEYLGSEHGLAFSNMGRMLTKDGNIKFTGAEDLLFRNRKTRKLLLGDIKTYGGLENFSDQQSRYVAAQIMMYSMADQFRDGGNIAARDHNPDHHGKTFDSENSGGFEDLFVLAPDSNEGRFLKMIGASPEKIDSNFNGIKGAIRIIQGLADAGMSVSNILAAREMAFKEIYGKVIDENTSLFDDETKLLLSNKRAASAGGIGAALTIHDEYQKMAGRVEKISSSIARTVKGEGGVYNPWAAFDATIGEAERMRDDLEANNRHTEALSLTKEIEQAYENRRSALPQATVKGYQDAIDTINKIQTGATGTKVIDEAIKKWDAVTNAVTEANNAYEASKKRVVELDSEIKKLNQDKETEKGRFESEYGKAKAIGANTDKVLKEHTEKEKEIDNLIRQRGEERTSLELALYGPKNKDGTYKGGGAEDAQKEAEARKNELHDELRNSMIKYVDENYRRLAAFSNQDTVESEGLITILDKVKEYKKPIQDQILNVDKLIKSGIIDIFEGNGLKYDFNKLLGKENMEGVESRIIDDTLKQATLQTNKMLGLPTRSTFIDFYSSKRAEIEQMIVDLNKIFENVQMNPAQTAAFDSIMSNLKGFDISAYASKQQNEQYNEYASFVNRFSTRKDQVEFKYAKANAEKTAKEAEMQAAYPKYFDELSKNYPVQFAALYGNSHEYKMFQLLQKSRAISLDQMMQNELNAIDLNNDKTISGIISNLYGGPNITIRDMAKSIGNQLSSLQVDGAEIPHDLKPYITNDFKIDEDRIAEDLRKRQSQILEQRHRAEMARLEFMNNQQIQKRNMSQTQYGNDIIGRAVQQTDQQYMSYKSQEFQYEQAIQDMKNEKEILESQKTMHESKGDQEQASIDQQKIDQITDKMSRYQDMLHQTQDAMKGFSNGAALVNNALINIGNSLQSLMTRLGRRVLMNAYREAISFAKQFNKDMITIQQITGKSDEEMEDIKSSSITQAKGLRTTVSNVTQTRAALYRQGLNDSEVKQRTEDIIMFSTVTGQKVTDATSNLTAAIQTGLVSTVTEAMDVLAALGDSAATTAEEISKGMKKAAASANVAGVSFNELTAMLTIATSETQLSGTQAGTFFQSLFARMRRVTTEKLLIDEGGEATSINDVEAALKQANIALRDGSNFRNTFDVLRDLAKVWNGLDDLRKSNITYAMAGTRNANMFSALMEGMGADGGKQLDEYLGIAESSEGTVKTKYEIAIKGIQAAVDNLKASFDDMIGSLGSSNFITGALDFLANALSGISEMNQGLTGLHGTLSAIGTVLTVLLVKAIAFKALEAGFFKGVAGTVSTLAAGGALLIGLSRYAAIGEATNEKKQEKEKAEDKRNKTIDKAVNREKAVQDNVKTIKDITSLYGKYNTLSDLSSEHSDKLSKAIKNLSLAFPDLAGNIDQATASMGEYAEFADKASHASKEMTKDRLHLLVNTSDDALEQNIEEANKNLGETDKLKIPTREEIVDRAFPTVPGDTLSTTQGIRNAISNAKSYRGFDPEVDKFIINALDTYLPSMFNIGKWGQYSSAEELLNTAEWRDPEEIASFSEYINGLYSVETDKSKAKEQLKNVFTKTYGSIWSLLTQDNEQLSDYLLDQYLSQYTSDNWFNKDTIKNFFNSLIDDENITKGINQTSGFFKYNIGGRFGFGFDEFSEANILSKFIEMWKYYEETGNLDGIAALTEFLNMPIINGHPITFMGENGLEQGSIGESDDGSEMLEYQEIFDPNNPEHAQYIDFDKMRNETTINGTNGQKLYRGIGDIAATVQRSSKEKGYTDEYKQLYNALSTSVTFADFNDATKLIGEMPAILQADPELDRYIDQYAKATGEEAQKLRKTIMNHMFEKAFSVKPEEIAINFGKQMMELSSIARISNTDINDLTPEMKSQMASTFGKTMQQIEDGIKIYYNLIQRQYQNGIEAVQLQIQMQLQETLDAWLIEQGYRNDDGTANYQKFLEDPDRNVIRNQALADLTAEYIRTIPGFRSVIDENGQVKIVGGDFTPRQEDPFAQTKSLFTSSDLTNTALQLLDKQIEPDDLSYEKKSEIANKYPELVNYLNGNAEYKYENRPAVRNRLMQDKIANLVTSGQLSDTYQNPLVTATTALDINSRYKAANEIAGTFKGLAKAYSAYENIVAKNFTETDLNLLADFLGIEDEEERLKFKTLSPDEIKEKYGNIVSTNKTSDLQQLKVIRDNLTGPLKDYFETTLLPYGFTVSNLGVGFTPGKIQNSLADQIIANENSYQWQTDNRAKYAQLLSTIMDNYLYEDGIDREALLEYITEDISKNDKAFYDELYTNGQDIITSFSNRNDYDALNALYNKAYDVPLDMSMLDLLGIEGNSALMNMVNSIKNGDIDELSTLHSGSILYKALSELIGGNFETLLSSAMSPEGLTDAQIHELDQAVQTTIFKRLTDRSGADVYDSKLFDSALGFWGGSTEQQTEASNAFFEQAKTISEARNVLTEMSEGKRDINIDELKKFAEQFGMIKKDIENLQADTSGVNEVINALDSFGSRFNSTADAVASQLESSGNTVLEMLANWIRGLISIANGESNELETYTLNDIYSWANGTSNYASNKKLNNIKRDIADLARSSRSYDEFMTGLMAKGYTKSEMETISKDSDIAPIFSQMYKTNENGGLITQDYVVNGETQLDKDGNPIQVPIINDNAYDWLTAQQKLINVSPYSGLEHDSTYNAYMTQLNDLFGGAGGGGFVGNLMAGNVDITQLRDYLAGGEGSDLRSWIESLDGGKQALSDFLDVNKNAQASAKQLANVLRNEGSKAMKDYGDDTDEVNSTLEGLSKNSRSAIKTQTQLMKQMDKLHDVALATSKMRGKSGKQLDKATLKQIAGYTELSESEIKQLSKEQIEKLADGMEAASDEEFAGTIGNVIEQRLAESLNAAVANGDMTAEVAKNLVFKVMADGQIDLSEVQELAGQLNDDVLATLASYAGEIGELALALDVSEDALKASLIFTALGKVKGNLGRSRGGGGGYRDKDSGGGGGGGKSAAEKLLQNLKNRIAISDHKIKMAQLQETKYEQMGELGNVNNMIEVENKYQLEKIERLKDAMSQLENELSKTARGSDDWQKLYEQWLQYEEAIDETNNTIAANTKKIKENHQAILKTHTDLEQTLEDEIKNRIQIQRDMLDATVQMQDTIIEAIRQRYQDEWDIMKQDMDKQKEALEEKKSLIDEELQKRKEAEDEAEKYEQLAEYRRQLALISADSTRTRDAAELQKKITDLEKDISWKIAEDEAKAETESIDDQIKAIDQYQQYGDEDLEAYLENANNFANEVNKVLGGTDTELYDWLKNNIKDYMLSLEDAQEQMLQGWTDTYKQMYHIVDTYWEQINEILSSREAFAAYMMDSDEYKYASEDMKAQLLYQWLDVDAGSGSYDAWVAARRNQAKYAHDGEEFANYTGEDGGGGDGNGAGGPGGNKDDNDDGNKNNGKNYRASLEGKGGDKNYVAYAAEDDNLYGDVPDAFHKNPITNQDLIETRKATVEAEIAAKKAAANEEYRKQQQKQGNIPSGVGIEKEYANGGDVDYTGWAWVDGTRLRPEAFLDADDRDLMRSLLDSDSMMEMREMMRSFQRINTRSLIANIYRDDGKGEMSAAITIYDGINVTTEHINDDIDMADLAQKIGNEFVKKLSDQGMFTSRFSF